MADTWENLHGFNPNNPSDGTGDADGDGYTNVEEFLNGTAPRSGAPAPTPTPTPAPTATPLPPPLLTSISVNPTSASIQEGSDQQFTATGTFSDASTEDVTSSATWASMNEAVAVIDAFGLATGVLAGTSNITASQGGATGTSILEVVPPISTDKVAITFDFYSAKWDLLGVVATSSSGGSVTLTATAFESDNVVTGSGVMAYNAELDRHQRVILGLAAKPFRVEVTSTGGGSDRVHRSLIAGRAR